MQIVIITSDRTSWALRPLAYTIRCYWDIELNVLVGGYTPPAFPMPPGWVFHSLGAFVDYPANRWSDGLIKLLEFVHSDLVLLHFDDFWLTRPVDQAALRIAHSYMNDNPGVARFDLTSDRLGAAGIVDAGNAGHLDLVKAPKDSPYNFSYQTAIWRREMLLDLIAPGESAAQSEMNGNGRLFERGYGVVGTRQVPIKYCIAVQHGQLAFDGGYQGENHALKPADAEYIKAQGWIPDGLTGGYANA